MPSGLTTGGIDLDDIFLPYTSGPKASQTGYQVSGSDLANRYAPYTSGEKASVTGYQVAGNDLANIFAKYVEVGLKGGTIRVIRFMGRALGSWIFKTNGEVEALGGLVNPHEIWLPSGSASDYDIRFTHLSGNTPSGVFNSWMNLSRTRRFTLSTNGSHKTCSVRVEIRKAGANTVLVFNDYHIHVEAAPA
ncbi:hypothetical protein [Pleionea sp. CnH1-48]|uniref:hypothetical protein n=1 Tax=Pleionea sp. CnH1-48 TaxID=2954494 RepID=UPI0020968804|nr:hypothetical protein [Pleionea sp. CnH1-48]MCO7225931.1 hypothetical protein [Pleionea sp. CnH1-48]